MREHRYTFSGKRTPCPRCGRRKTFAAFNESPGFGHCFGCGETIYPLSDRSPLPALPCLKENKDHNPLPFSEVARTLIWSDLLPITERECTEIDERAAIMEFDGTMSREEANEASGYNQILRLTDELTALRLLNPFAETLVRMTRPSILKDWNIGFTAKREVLFWYQNIEGKFVNAKSMCFLDDGFHRNKCDDFANRFIYKGFPTCLFGEFQLNPQYSTHRGEKYGPAVPIILVEAEKTAIILSHHKPGFIWLATSGTSGLTERKARVLKGRDVKVLFDCDQAGEEGAQRACKTLESVGAKADKLDQWKLCDSPNEGFDIADLIYQQFIMNEHNR